ncbi:unnamed protein product (plasmid) [Mycetohabitans rhizoxinica HKI 454]|uniref:Uncharacterized protein n=1 Tax=Mycetohabitans rhizoxinica (strain DSM 19002 / CIP 109453 / HKI 454) TaxID=882378 RepID=E5AVN3_MYCRK|nr:unnamed protein product [Mycetohabitans rhizoxinica HKI 454]
MQWGCAANTKKLHARWRYAVRLYLAVSKRRRPYAHARIDVRHSVTASSRDKSAATGAVRADARARHAWINVRRRTPHRETIVSRCGVLQCNVCQGR